MTDVVITDDMVERAAEAAFFRDDLGGHIPGRWTWSTISDEGRENYRLMVREVLAAALGPGELPFPHLPSSELRELEAPGDCDCGAAHPDPAKRRWHTVHAGNRTGHSVGCPVYARWRDRQAAP